MCPSRTSLALLVVQETDWLQRGPHQQHHLFERLSQRGHEISVVDFETLYTPWPRAPLVAHSREWDSVSRVVPQARVRVIRPGTLRIPVLARSLSILMFYRELSALTRKLRPDIIIDYAISTGLPALAIARRFEIPFAMHVIDALHTLVPTKALHPVARYVERRLLRAADHTVYINHDLQDYGVRLGAREEQSHTIQSGVDLDQFRPDLEAAALRRELGFAENDIVLLFVGWLYDFAGIDSIMRVLPDLPSNVRLLVVGTGEAEARLLKLQHSLSLEDRVTLTGKQPYKLVPNFMALSDICLMYSTINQVTRHIVPIKTYEYLASGKPVLASQLPGLMREIPPGNGIIYTSPNQLRLALKRLVDPETRRIEGARARAFAETYCDWEKLTDDFEKLLLRVAKI